MDKKISIITAVYNNQTEIRNAVDSVLAQSYPNIEYIVVDGASNDGTTEIIQSYGGKITRFISEPDKGIYDALNKGLNLATGEIVGILHSDDIFFSNDTLTHVAATFVRTGCDAVYGDLLYVSKADTSNVVRFWKSSPFDATKFKTGWMPAHPTLFMKKEVYEQYGLFDLRYRIASDYDLMLRTLGSGQLHAEYVPEVITRMRVGGASNKSFKNIWRKSKEDYLALKRNKMGGFWTLAFKNLSKVSQFVKKRK
jgi:glycosyltransferase involved in cell wall biosynthesis